MREKVFSLLQEERANPRQWTREEVNDYLNEGEDEHNKLSRQLRERVSYTVGLYGNTFPVPGGALEIASAHYWDGTDEKPLELKTRRDNDRDYGEGWEDETTSQPWRLFESLLEETPYFGIRDYLSLYPISSADDITIAQEDLSAELNGVGELVWLEGDTSRGIPVGLSDDEIYPVDGQQFGMVVGVYERDADDDDALFIETPRCPRGMESDGDEPEIRKSNHMAVVNYAMYRCLSRPGETQDMKTAAHYLKLFDSDRRANRGQPVVRADIRVRPWRV
jgi:hypothetical protein